MLDDETRNDDDLPEHEFREVEGESVGGGLMSSGGTAVDRGTGTLGGQAQGINAGNDRVTGPDTEADATDPDADDDADLALDTPAVPTHRGINRMGT